MKPHLHKLPTYRNPASRQRAVLYPLFGTKNAFGVLFFEFRRRYAFSDQVYASRADAMTALRDRGFSVKA